MCLAKEIHDFITRPELFSLLMCFPSLPSSRLVSFLSFVSRPADILAGRFPTRRVCFEFHDAPRRDGGHSRRDLSIRQARMQGPFLRVRGERPRVPVSAIRSKNPRAADASRAGEKARLPPQVSRYIRHRPRDPSCSHAPACELLFYLNIQPVYIEGLTKRVWAGEYRDGTGRERRDREKERGRGRERQKADGQNGNCRAPYSGRWENEKEVRQFRPVLGPFGSSSAAPFKVHLSKSVIPFPRTFKSTCCRG